MERGKRQILRLLYIFPFALFSLLAPQLFISNRSSPPSTSIPPQIPLLSASSNSTRSTEENPHINSRRSFISCDRTAFSTDICTLYGDVRTNPSSFSIHLHSTQPSNLILEKIKPYARKWETQIMKTITELNLISNNDVIPNLCNVTHTVPAVVFSTGGYTGNVFHDFRDVIVPLYITSHRFNREVIFLIVNYRESWCKKYWEILSTLSAYPPTDFFSESRTRCFSEVTVGLHFHEDLAIEPSRTIPVNTSINDFQKMLYQAYFPSKPSFELNEKKKLKLVIISRKGSRAIENEMEVVQLCEKLGFRVQVLRPDTKMKLAEIYWALNPSDVMVGVVGCALTHLLFMRPGAVFIQVKPLGTEWAAETNYGTPAKKIGLKYIPYRVTPKESSLSRVYEKEDPAVADPESIAIKGWEVTKRVFMDKQTVKLDLKRFNKSLNIAYQYLIEQDKK